MKNQIRTIKALVIAAFASSAMLGCANNNSGNNSVQVRSSGAAPTTLATTTGQMTYNGSTTGSNFNVPVQALLNESIPAGTTIGSVNTIVMGGQVHFDAASPTQNLISSQSFVQIQITTSGSTTPFLISVGENSSGKGTLSYASSTATANMMFQDQYGWIQVYGQFGAGSPSIFTGQIYFGSGMYNNGVGGTYLGNFSIQTCSFFSCQ
jgi:hypothetical protein